MVSVLYFDPQSRVESLFVSGFEVNNYILWETITVASFLYFFVYVSFVLQMQTGSRMNGLCLKAMGALEDLEMSLDDNLPTGMFTFTLKPFIFTRLCVCDGTLVSFHKH